MLIIYIFLILRIDFIIIIKYDGFEDPEDYTMVMPTEIVLPVMGRVAGFKIPRNGQELEVQTSKKGNNYAILEGFCPYTGKKMKLVIYNNFEKFQAMER
ncbi:MAG: hypothetical protein WCJ33_08820 [Pseudomonadota bacterium]